MIYINPPYAEAGSATTPAGTGKNKELVAKGNKIAEKYKEVLGKANNELFAQFFMRIYMELGGCVLGCFSKLKYLNSQNFIKFREVFKAKFINGFITPADTFDNVKGHFPIGFLIWDTSRKESIKEVDVDIFDKENRFLGQKVFSSQKLRTINQWFSQFESSNRRVCILGMGRSDFQHTQLVRISSSDDFDRNKNVSPNILIEAIIYFAVSHTIESTWINDRDQFYAPNSLWEEDKEFQSDCLAFTLFHGQNRITSTEGTNHFIPFTESEIGAKSAFESDFMTRFMRGKVELDNSSDSLFGGKSMSEKLEFSSEARAVFEAGREVFAYYHSQDFSTKPYNVNASLYDIKEFFQGRNSQGKMNLPSKAEDSHYKTLIATLTDTLNTLAKKLEPKIYEYGFLKE